MIRSALRCAECKENRHADGMIHKTELKSQRYIDFFYLSGSSASSTIDINIHFVFKKLCHYTFVYNVDMLTDFHFFHHLLLHEIYNKLHVIYLTTL